jgi:hypothetical protein
MEFLVGTGLGLAAIGIALFLGVPPPGWSGMPRPMVRFCLGAGACLFMSGLALMAIGGCHENDGNVCRQIVLQWSVLKPWAAVSIVIVACIGGLFGIWLHADVERGRRLGTWGPWVLIIGGPVLGFFWLYIERGPSPPHDSIPPKTATVEDRWIWSPLTPAQIEAVYLQLRGTKPRSFFISCNKAECTALADSFDMLFRRLGWPRTIGDAGFYAVGVTGIAILSTGETAKALKEALEANTILRPELTGQDSAEAISLIIGNKPEVMPTGPLNAPPRGPLAGLTNAQLKERAIALANDLRRLESDYDSRRRQLSYESFARLRKLPTDEAKSAEFHAENEREMKLGDEKEAAFRTRYRSDAIILREELERRLNALPMPENRRFPGAPPLPPDQTIFDMPMLVGVAPLSGGADLLEYWAKQLP